MGRFLQSGWLSILVSTSLKTGFLDLQERTEGGSSEGGSTDTRRERWGQNEPGGRANPPGPQCQNSHSHQPLQGSLLVDLIGAICDKGIKVGLSMLVNDVADAIDHNVLLVSLLQFLKESEYRMNTRLVCQGFRAYMATARVTGIQSRVTPHGSK